MTDSTKKLFDAPWKLYEYRDDYDHWFQVLTNGGRLIASRIVNKEDYNRIARLPELYEALMVAAYEHCRVCLYGHAKDARQMPKPDDMARNGCTLSDFPHCPNRNWWNLLKKVRYGE